MEKLKKPVHPKYLWTIITIIFLLGIYYLSNQYNVFDLEGYLIFSFFWTFFYYLLYKFIIIPEYKDKVRWYKEKKKYQITLEKEIAKYRETLLSLLHPSGMKVLGRYALKSDPASV